MPLTNQSLSVKIPILRGQNSIKATEKQSTQVIKLKQFRE
jgi:hypothetical protein